MTKLWKVTLIIGAAVVATFVGLLMLTAIAGMGKVMWFFWADMLL